MNSIHYFDFMIRWLLSPWARLRGGAPSSVENSSEPTTASEQVIEERFSSKVFRTHDYGGIICEGFVRTLSTTLRYSFKST